MSVSEIEAAITQLPPGELAELLSWLRQYEADAWDKQIEADMKAGRLDRILAEVDAEHAAGLSRPL